MITLILASLLLCVAGVTFAILREDDKELPDSFSALVYTLPDRLSLLWSVWLWCITILLMPSLFEHLSESLEFLGFLMVVSLVFCAALPLSDRLEHGFTRKNHNIHNWLAGIGGILSQACVCLISPLWLLFWLIIPALALLDVYVLVHPIKWALWILKKLDGKFIFLVESICALTLYCSLLLS